MKAVVLVALTFFLSIANVQAQQTEVPKDENPSNAVFDTWMLGSQASYIGGKDSLIKLIQNNLSYPKEALDAEIQGTVPIQFIVEKDGSISDLKFIGEKKLGHGLEEEAMRIVKMTSGKWNPARAGGLKVRSIYGVPLVFKLN